MDMTLLNESRAMEQGQEVRDVPRHQGPRDIPGAAHFVNVGNAERWTSAIAGGAIIAAGLKSRSALGLVGAALGGCLVYRGLSGHCHGYAAFGVDTADHDGAAPEDYFARGIHVEESMTVNRTPWDLYQFWRNFDNLPRFIST